MMNFIARAGLADTLAPRPEGGKDALYDALRSKDSKRAIKIIERAASMSGGRGSSRRLISSQEEEEVNWCTPLTNITEYLVSHL